MNGADCKAFLLGSGALSAGVIDLVQENGQIPAKHFIKKAFPDAKSVIVYTMRFPKSRYAEEEMETYNRDFCALIERVDGLAAALRGKLEAESVKGIVVPSDEEIAEDLGLASLRHLAVLAGLGMLGKNNLLLTPEAGNMVILSAVITDKKMEGDRPLGREICLPKCTRCIDVCPEHALGDGLTRKALCKRTVTDLGGGETECGCGLCRFACPLNEQTLSEG